MPLDSGVLGLGRSALLALRHAMGEAGAGSLQQAGFAAGGELYDGFTAWLKRTNGVSDPAELDAEQLGQVLGDFFEEFGWGWVAVTRVGEAGLAIDAPNWAEGEPGAEEAGTSCHVSSGMLSAFLTKLAGQDMAVMEVECLTAGHDRCRFLAGAPETLEMVYQAMGRGLGYEEALGT